MTKTNGRKFTITFLILIAVTGAAASLWIKKAYDTRLPISMTTPSEKTIDRLYDATIYDVTTALSALIESKINLHSLIKGSAKMKACQTIFIDYAGVDMSTFAERFVQNKEAQFCAEENEFGLTLETKKGIADFCFDQIDLPKCKMHLLNLRAASIAYLTQNVPAKNQSKQQLMLNMLQLTHKAQLTASDLKQMKIVSEELYARDPKLPTNQQAFLIAEVTPLLLDSKAAGLSESTMKTIDRLQLERPHDEQIEDFKFASEWGLDQDVRFKNAYDRVLKSPDSAAANYALAWLYNKKGDHAAEIKLLQRSVNTAPTNPTYTETLSRFRSGERDGIYLLKLTYGRTEN